MCLPVGDTPSPPKPPDECPSDQPAPGRAMGASPDSRLIGWQWRDVRCGRRREPTHPERERLRLQEIIKAEAVSGKTSWRLGVPLRWRAGFHSHPRCPQHKQPWPTSPGTEVWSVLGISWSSPRKCWQWAAPDPASSRACFHMFLLHDYAPHTG